MTADHNAPALRLVFNKLSEIPLQLLRMGKPRTRRPRKRTAKKRPPKS